MCLFYSLAIFLAITCPGPDYFWLHKGLNTHREEKQYLLPGIYTLSVHALGKTKFMQSVSCCS